MTTSPDQCDFCKVLQNPQAEATFIAAFDHSVAFLNFAQDSYPERAVLMLKNHHDHLHQVPIDMQRAVVPEMARLTAAILKAYGGFRANHQSLGNQTTHVHWHITPRYPNDLNAGRAPTYSEQDDVRLNDDDYKQRAARIRAALEEIK